MNALLTLLGVETGDLVCELWKASSWALEELWGESAVGPSQVVSAC